jgi:hypothetical protein
MIKRKLQDQEFFSEIIILKKVVNITLNWSWIIPIILRGKLG